MNSMMNAKIFACVAGVSLASVGFGADAMPAGSVAQPSSNKAPSNIQLAAEGCGPGYMRGPAGGCRPMRGRAVIVERPVVVVPARPVVRVAPVVRAGPCGVRVGPVAVRTGC